jgi:hypothetical protein
VAPWQLDSPFRCIPVAGIRVRGTALKNPELWLVVSGFWLMVTGWMQVDSGIVMASGSP